MSHHEGVSCDSCLKANFRGKRYKCLVCFDYDLCATCFDNGATSTRHTAEHAMQCILTRADVDLFYGGESVTSDAPQAFTCPFCGRMGLTEVTLQEHVNSEHLDASAEVVCPICASVPAGEPNNVTEDFATHLQVEHRSAQHEEPQASVNRSSRRAPHPTRSINSTRARRTQMQYSSAASGLSALSPSTRDSMDPIAELLSQLSGVRRAANLGQPHSQLQQLQMQLERHNNGVAAAVGAPPNLTSRAPFADRAPIERVIRRHQQSSSSGSGLNGHLGHPSSVGVGGQQLPYVVLMEPSPSPSSLQVSGAAGVATASLAGGLSSSGMSSSHNSKFLLSRNNESNCPEAEQQAAEVQKADKSLFVQELLLTTLADNLSLDDSANEVVAIVDEVTEEVTPTGDVQAALDSASSQDNSNCSQASVDFAHNGLRGCEDEEESSLRQATEVVTLEAGGGVGESSNLSDDLANCSTTTTAAATNLNENGYRESAANAKSGQNSLSSHSRTSGPTSPDYHSRDVVRTQASSTSVVRTTPPMTPSAQANSNNSHLNRNHSPGSQGAVSTGAICKGHRGTAATASSENS